MAFERNYGKSRFLQQPFWKQPEGVDAWLPKEKKSTFELETYREFCKTESTYRQVETRNELSFEIKKAIETSKQLLEYGDDWDGEGALGYLKHTLDKAEKFLTDNALTFWKNNAVWITAPDFCPGPDGSIDLLWKLEDRELLINIPVNENNLAGYYGDSSKNGSIIKGKLNLTEENQWILMWLMK